MNTPVPQWPALKPQPSALDRFYNALRPVSHCMRKKQASFAECMGLGVPASNKKPRLEGPAKNESDGDSDSEYVAPATKTKKKRALKQGGLPSKRHKRAAEQTVSASFTSKAQLALPSISKPRSDVAPRENTHPNVVAQPAKDHSTATAENKGKQTAHKDGRPEPEQVLVAVWEWGTLGEIGESAR